MIVVTGATGKIGAELLRLLAERGETVRAVSRSPAKSQTLPRVEWIAADLAQPERLPAAVDGAEKLFLLTALDAARRSGVKHVVKLSGEHFGKIVLRM